MTAPHIDLLPTRGTSQAGALGAKLIPGCGWCGSVTVRVPCNHGPSSERKCPRCGHTSMLVWTPGDPETWRVV